MRIRELHVDINKTQTSILKYKQYDKDILLKVKIVENKKEVDLTGYDVVFHYLFPSGLTFDSEATIVDNEINIMLSSEIFEENGKVFYEIEMSNSEQIVTTFRHYFVIEKSILK